MHTCVHIHHPNPRSPTRKKSLQNIPRTMNRPIWEISVRELIEKNVLWVPTDHKDTLLRIWGGQTFKDFDNYWGFKDIISGPYETSFQNMMHYMNICDEEDDPEALMSYQFEKLKSQHVKDMFNLVQSCIRTRVGEHVWYA